MQSKAGKQVGRQAVDLPERLRQLLLPMLAGMAATKTDLMNWVHEVGLGALSEVFREDAEAIAGPRASTGRDGLTATGVARRAN